MDEDDHGITAADITANFETIGDNMLRLASARAADANLTLAAYIETVLGPVLLAAGHDAGGVRDVRGPAARCDAEAGPMTARAAFTFNPPRFWDKPTVIAEMWRLTKGARVAVCELVNHPSRRGEVRCVIDGETFESQADNHPLVLFDVSDRWRQAFEEGAGSCD